MSSRAAAWSGSPRGASSVEGPPTTPRTGSHRRADPSPRPRRHPMDVGGRHETRQLYQWQHAPTVAEYVRRSVDRARINAGPASRRSCLSNHVRSAGSSGRRPVSTWSRSPRPMARRAVFFTLRLPQSWPAITVSSSTWVTGISKVTRSRRTRGAFWNVRPADGWTEPAGAGSRSPTTRSPSAASHRSGRSTTGIGRRGIMRLGRPEALGQGTIQQLVRNALDGLLPQPLEDVRVPSTDHECGMMTGRSDSCPLLPTTPDLLCGIAADCFDSSGMAIH